MPRLASEGNYHEASLIWLAQALASVRAALDAALGEVAAQAGGTVAAITEELAGACSGTAVRPPHRAPPVLALDIPLAVSACLWAPASERLFRRRPQGSAAQHTPLKTKALSFNPEPLNKTPVQARCSCLALSRPTA